VTANELPQPESAAETPEGPAIFRSDLGGLKDAADEQSELRKKRREPAPEPEPVAEDPQPVKRELPAKPPRPDEEPFNVREAADHLAEVRAKEAAERAEFDKARAEAAGLQQPATSDPVDQARQAADQAREVVREQEQRIAQEQTAKLQEAVASANPEALNVLLSAGFAQEFPEIRATGDPNAIVADLQQLNMANPERCNQALERLSQIKQVFTVATTERAAHHYGMVQDAEFTKRAGEMSPSRYIEVFEKAKNLAQKDTGWSDQELLHHWKYDPHFRSWQNQVRLFERVQAQEAKERHANLSVTRVRPNPPVVLRPGSRDASQPADHSEVSALSRRLDRSGNVKDATALLIAQRKAQQR
jgi:hypothetical protein